jgi:hypothetical protein
VKYAQCVKIWPFDILVLFMMSYVLFLKPCVQFLIDTILNLAIVQFLIKKKGDTCYGSTSPISIKARHSLWGHISYLNKRETHVMGAHLPFT